MLKWKNAKYQLRGSYFLGLSAIKGWKSSVAGNNSTSIHLFLAFFKSSMSLLANQVGLDVSLVLENLLSTKL